MPTTARAYSSSHGSGCQWVADSRVDGLAFCSWGDLGGSIMLGERAGTVIAGQADLLRRRRHKLFPVHGHSKATGSHIESGSLELHFPRVDLASVGFTPG